MIWILIGIIPPFLWAVVNHIDKYLLSKAHHKSSVNVLMVYSTGFSLILLPFLFSFAKDNLFVSLEQVLVQIVGGILLTFSIYFYLKALYRGETSIVMPLALLVPIFGYFFSYFLLGETVSFKQLISCALIIGGALLLSFEISEEHKKITKFNYRVLSFMILSTGFEAMQETIFKFSTVKSSFLVSLFWLHVGIILYGLVLVFLNKNLFGHFLESVRENGRFMFGVNFISEFVSSVAFMAINYAILLAPIFIILSLKGFQPVFVFILGTLLTLFFPRFVKEKIRPIHLLHKGVAITVMVLGTILISQTF